MSNVMDIISDTYLILEKLDEGSGGIVYKAYHKRLKKEVVLKKIRKRSIDSQINRQETDILKNLNHMYLPQILDFLDVGEDIYTVMSFIPGKSFKQLLDQRHRFTQNELITWGMQICSALNYLHNQNPPIIHSDIKPANIMLTPNGNVCLIDFNISFFLDDNVILGYTHGYTSPEQYIIAIDKKSIHAIPNHSIVDEKSDIYSVGATFYHLATGKRLDNFNTADIDCLISNTSEAFAQIIFKAIQPEPKNRYKNAFEMFKALQNVTRNDERYQKLIKKQKMIRSGLIAAMAGFIILAGYGIRTIQHERIDKYNDLVEIQMDYLEKGDYEASKRVHKEAVQILPSGVETFYQQAYALYKQQNFENCIEFINYNILGNEKLELSEDKISEIYYLMAENYSELEQYDKAVMAYERLFKYGGYDVVYYRDYTIALAYNDNYEKAEQVLNQAIEYGLVNDSILYAKGEIEKAVGKNETALENFQMCIQNTEDNKLKEKSYLMISQIFEEQGDLKEQRKILWDATESLPVTNQMLILEKLIQTDIDIAEKTGQGRYRDEAISLLEIIIDQGWDSYTTYNNLVILNEKQGYFDVAEDHLELMKQLFGEDYNIYKRYAFLEIDKQELKENRYRNYKDFESYYNVATQMYQEQLENNNTDTEMELLDTLYQKIRLGGWL